jgi:hypothetical protein
VIASLFHRDYCLEILPNAILEDSVVLGSRTMISSSKIFVLIGTQVISCLSGLALQINDLDGVSKVVNRAEGVIVQGIADPDKDRQSLRYSPDKCIFTNSTLMKTAVELEIRGCRNGASVPVTLCAGDSTKKWIFQEPPVNFTLGDSLPPAVREFLNPGLQIKFHFPKVRIVPVSRSDLVIEFNADAPFL